MADQGVRYVVSLQDLNVTSGLKSMESSAMRTEASIASLNSTLGTMAGAFGVGIGLHQLVSFGRDAVQGAADYETAVKRIKFASDNLIEGEKNIAFIRSEVDKFKIPLQETTDAYGKFLAMVTGSGMAGDQVRKLHDELLLIGKVKGLGDGQLDAAVMNLGKMLESGSLDARHFRPLEQQLSGIGAFVAKELGISVHELAILRNQGKMTTIDPKVLLRAIEKQAESLAHFLPESTTTIQSGINEVNTAWLEFKNNLVFDNREELIALFDTLREGIGYLREHKDEISTLGHLVADAAKIWLVYKGAMVLANGIQAIMLIGTGAQSAAFVTQASAVAGLNTQIALLNANLEIMIGLQAQGAASAIAMTEAQAINQLTYSSLAAKNLPINMMGAAGAATAGAATLGSAISGAVIPVAIAYFGGQALAQLIPNNPITGEGWNLGKIANAGKLSEDGKASQAELGMSILGMFGFDPITDALNKLQEQNRKPVMDLDALLKQDWFAEKKNPFFPGLPTGKDKDKTKATNKILPPKDSVTGQRVITYNIRIHEVNGQKIATQTVEGTKADTQSVAASMRDIITSILNDSQIRAAG